METLQTPRVSLIYYKQYVVHIAPSSESTTRHTSMAKNSLRDWLELLQQKRQQPHCEETSAVWTVHHVTTTDMLL